MQQRWFKYPFTLKGRKKFLILPWRYVMSAFNSYEETLFDDSVTTYLGNENVP